MEPVTINFEYKLPDEYLYQTTDLQKTANFDYTGPAAIWCYVNKDTGSLDTTIYTPINSTTSMDDAIANCPGDQYKIMKIIAEQEPLICHLVVPQDFDRDALPIKEYTLENESEPYYSRPDPTPPDHTYDKNKITYNFILEKWNEIPFLEPHITWERLNETIQDNLTDINKELENKELSDSDREKLEKHKNEFEIIPTKYINVDPWQVPFPLHPFSPDTSEGELSEDEIVEDSQENIES